MLPSFQWHARVGNSREIWNEECYRVCRSLVGQKLTIYNDTTSEYRVNSFGATSSPTFRQMRSDEVILCGLLNIGAAVADVEGLSITHNLYYGAQDTGQGGATDIVNNDCTFGLTLEGGYMVELECCQDDFESSQPAEYMFGFKNDSFLEQHGRTGYETVYWKLNKIRKFRQTPDNNWENADVPSGTKGWDGIYNRTLDASGELTKWESQYDSRGTLNYEGYTLGTTCSYPHYAYLHSSGDSYFAGSTDRVIDLTGFDSSAFTSMAYMFSECKNLVQLDATPLATSNVTTMAYMFAGDYSLTQLRMTAKNVSKVTDMSYMFVNCYGFGFDGTLSLVNWATTALRDMSYMFAEMDAIKEIDLRGWNLTKVTDMTNWLKGTEVQFLRVTSSFFARTTSNKVLDLTSVVGMNWNGVIEIYEGDNGWLSHLVSVAPDWSTSTVNQIKLNTTLKAQSWVASYRVALENKGYDVV